MTRKVIKDKVIKQQLNEIHILHDGRMTVSNVAKYMDFSESMIRQMMCKGLGPAWYKMGAKVYFYQADVDKWMELQKTNASFMPARRKALKNKDEMLDFLKNDHWPS